MNGLFTTVAGWILIACLVSWIIFPEISRRRVATGLVLLTVRYPKPKLVFTVLLSVVSLVAILLFLYGTSYLFGRDSNVTFPVSVLVLGGLLFLGKTAFNLTTSRAQIIFTDKGIILPNSSILWKDACWYQWSDTLKENVRSLVIAPHIARSPIVVLRFYIDIVTIQNINLILDKYIGRENTGSEISDDTKKIIAWYQ